jgi:hypothetical protein
MIVRLYYVEMAEINSSIHLQSLAVDTVEENVAVLTRKGGQGWRRYDQRFARFQDQISAPKSERKIVDGFCFSLLKSRSVQITSMQRIFQSLCTYE